MAGGLIFLGNWNCRCTIEDKPGDTLAVALELTPGGGTLSEREADFRSPIRLSLDLGGMGIHDVANMTSLRGSRGAGKNISAYATVSGIKASEVQAVIISFAGVTERMVL